MSKRWKDAFLQIITFLVFISIYYIATHDKDINYVLIIIIIVTALIPPILENLRNSK